MKYKSIKILLIVSFLFVEQASALFGFGDEKKVVALKNIDNIQRSSVTLVFSPHTNWHQDMRDFFRGTRYRMLTFGNLEGVELDYAANSMNVIYAKGLGSKNNVTWSSIKFPVKYTEVSTGHSNQKITKVELFYPQELIIDKKTFADQLDSEENIIADFNQIFDHLSKWNSEKEEPLFKLAKEEEIKQQEEEIKRQEALRQHKEALKQNEEREKEREKESKEICANWKVKLEQLSGFDKVQFYNKSLANGCK